MSADMSWRLRQQAAQLTRHFIDAGVSGSAELDAVGRLCRQLDTHTALLADASLLAGEVADRSRAGFAELTRLQEQADAMSALAVAVHHRLGAIAAAEHDAGVVATELLDALQDTRLP